MGGYQDVLSAALLLFLVMDPLGNIPAFAVALRDVPRQRQPVVLMRELLIALFVLLFFLFLGRYALELLGVSQSSLGVAGGIILFLIALKMIFPDAEQARGEGAREEPFIVPLAVPLVAGPSAMATVVLLTARNPRLWPAWCAALGLAWLVSAVILLLSTRLSRLLGPHVLLALQRLMGMVLTTVAAEMFISGVRSAFM